MLGDALRKDKGLKSAFLNRAPQTRRLSDSVVKAMGMGRNGPPPRAGMNFRCSGIPYLCPRMYAMALRGMMTLGEAPDSNLAWTFGTGTAFHTQFQEDYLQRLPKQVFQGWWRNRATGKVVKGEKLNGSTTLSHKWCAKPEDGEDYEYVELEFYSKAHRLTGHCDGVLVWPDTGPEIFELKTISAHGYKRVDPNNMGTPKAEHVAQVQAYMWLTGLRQARIMYLCKDLTKTPDKVLCEHLVEYDEEAVKAIQGMLGGCVVAVDAPQDGPLPDRLPECQTRSKSRMYCDGKSACFAG